MRIQYDVDHEVFTIDHPLVKRLEKGEITPREFMNKRGLRIDGIKCELDRETGVALISLGEAKPVARRKPKDLCGLTGEIVLENKEAILHVFPELQPRYDAYENIDPAKCTSCQKKSLTIDIINGLIDPKWSNRDLSSLKGILPAKAYDKLASGMIL